MEMITCGNPAADILLVQMVDDHDLAVIEKEAAYIRELSNGQEFCLQAVKVNSWNKDLSPWPAPAVFGNEVFGDGAEDTLKYLLKSVIPCQNETAGQGAKKTFIGGYSLAGLFALWSGYQTNRFDGIAAASPSVWFPHFTEYMQEHQIHADKIYLSLGDREEKTRNPVMSENRARTASAGSSRTAHEMVGNAIRKAYDLLATSGADCVLEWNKGNHFKDPDLRTAKAFAWLMNRQSRGVYEYR